MESGDIEDSAIVASSRYNQWWGPERGRFNEAVDGIVVPPLNDSRLSYWFRYCLIYVCID